MNADAQRAIAIASGLLASSTLLEFERKESLTMSDQTTIRALYIGWGIAAVALVFAVAGKHPHGFYVLLRWVCLLSFAFSAFAAAKTNRIVWAWLFAIEAVLFNPLVQIHLKRETWQAIDWLAIGSIGVGAALFRKELRT